jgi:TetR/AcrR family transcriptional regulator, tetracycline repressor protein
LAQLNTDLIAAAAFGVLDQHGVAGFSMRAVAEALSVTPMALYNHVPDKAGLAALIVDAAIDAHPLSTPTGDWQEDLWLIARWIREGSMRHPALQELRQAYRIWTPAMSCVMNRWIGHWQQSGLEIEQASLAASTSVLAISGLVEYGSMYCDRVPPDRAVASAIPKAQQYFIPDYDPKKQFELSARLVIKGVYDHLAMIKKKTHGVGTDALGHSAAVAHG